MSFLRRLVSRSFRRFILLSLLVTLLFATAPARVHYHLNRGQDALARGDAETAMACFRKAQRINPEHAETSFWMARACRKIGDLEGVQQHLDDSLRLGFQDQERLRREWWLVLAETGRIREVEPYLAGMLTNPGEDGIEICDAFALGYCLNLQYDKALALLTAWQTDYPDDFRPHFRRGRIHASDELQWAKAEAAFREALLRAPENPDVRRELGKTLLDLRQLDEAETHLRFALQSDPEDAAALLALAEVLAEQGRPAVAREYLRRVLNQDPRNDSARLLLADVTLKAGDAEESIRILMPLIELWPGDLKGQYYLARALRAAGRATEANAHFEEYANLEQNWQRLNQLKRLIDRRPHDPDLRYELGLLRLKHESRVEGVLWLQSVFLYAPNHPGAHRALADYYAKIGEEELAHRHRLLSAPSGRSTKIAVNPTIPSELP